MKAVRSMQYLATHARECVRCTTRDWQARCCSSVTGTRRSLATAAANPVAEEGIESMYPDLRIPDDVSLVQYVMDKFGKYANNVAVVEPVTATPITYKQLQETVYKLGTGLLKLGVKKGDVVTLWCPNNPNFIFTYLAVVGIGAVVSPISPLCTTDELARSMKHTKSKYLFTITSTLYNARKAATQCPDLKNIVVYGTSSEFVMFNSLLDNNGKGFPHDLKINPKEDLAVIAFSSGTAEGEPRGVQLTHYNMVANLEQTRTPGMLGYYPREETMISFQPYHRTYGQITEMLGGLIQGAKLVPMPKFDDEMFMKLVNGYHPTYLHMVPAMVYFLAKSAWVEKMDLSSIHTIMCGSVPLNLAIAEEAMERTGIPYMRQGYGLTEASGVTHMGPREGKLWKTVGGSIHNTLYKVADLRTGRPVGHGHEGELLVKGPQIMKGYVDGDSRQAVRDGWLHTGDIAHYNRREQIVISDRIQDLIACKGHQFAPADAELLLASHPGVLDAAVIGIPDEDAGELPAAVVVLEEDEAGQTKLSKQDLMKFIESSDVPYKLRGGIIIRKEIPRDSTGRIKRQQLREDYAS